MKHLTEGSFESFSIEGCIGCDCPDEYMKFKISIKSTWLGDYNEYSMVKHIKGGLNTFLTEDIDRDSEFLFSLDAQKVLCELMDDMECEGYTPLMKQTEPYALGSYVVDYFGMSSFERISLLAITHGALCRFVWRHHEDDQVGSAVVPLEYVRNVMAEFITRLN